MKKLMLILLICTALTACGNYETETVTQQQTEAVTQATTQITTTEITTEPVVTTTITTTLSETTSTTSTTTEAFITEKKNEIKARVTTAKVKYAEAVKTTTTTEVSEIVTTTTTSTTITAPPETTTVTTTTEVTQTESPKNNLTDYEKALAVYEYMTANGSGTCVQYAYATYEMCREYVLECYFTWTESKLYGHVANVVKVDGAWYVLDTQGRCFLTENMCGFTEIVDENESYIATADIISGIRYE